MRINTADIFPYHLPLRRPWATARGTMTQREGWLIALCAESGLTGWGDCAPLTAAGTEPPPVSLRALREFSDQCPGSEPQRLLQALDALPPAARCALESALLDLEAQAANQPLAALLGGQRHVCIKVNAACGALGDESARCISQAADAGYRIVKLKVGLTDPTQETVRLRRLAGQLDAGIRLRLDANGAWDAAQAGRFIDGIEGLPVESLEEPLRDADFKSLRALQARCPFPLALDESLAGRRPDELPDPPPVRRLVLKPPVLGGPLAALRWAARAQALGMETVITSTLESAIGVALCAQLAAVLPEDGVHGLATGGWFNHDLAELPVVAGGMLTLPGGAGIGVQPVIDRHSR